MGRAAKELRAGRLDKPDLRQLLGFETSDAIDRFRKTQGAYHMREVAKPAAL
jgi:hypothetical protein